MLCAGLPTAHIRRVDSPRDFYVAVVRLSVILACCAPVSRPRTIIANGIRSDNISISL